MDNSRLINHLGSYSKLNDITSREIAAQPERWQQTMDAVMDQQLHLGKFLSELYNKKDLTVVLTGAGSSAFIGVALQGPFQKNTGMLTRAISTTDLVTHPDLFFLKKRPTLLVSFARSGDSPESIAAVNLANEICDEIYHLVITCNENGKLARETPGDNDFVFLLPPETNDKGLAMTASFTSMLLSGILISRLDVLQESANQVKLLIDYGNNLIRNYAEKLEGISGKDFNRVVFLGSGPLHGAARESHLKLQELTDGMIICKHDSFLGLRHGPKAVIDKSTLVFYLFSNNGYARKYEDDLVSEICRQGKYMYTIGVSEKILETNYCLDMDIVMGDGRQSIDEEFLAVCHVLPAQILGYYKSLALGLNPDNPSRSGSISRVVQGVKIYSY